MKTITSQTASFGPYALDLRSGELRKFGTKVKMGEQTFRILRMLLEAQGELVTREELRAKLWAGDTFVDFDHGLNSAVQRLRDCLSDSAEKLRWVETVPRRGYRFVGQVEWSEKTIANAGTRETPQDEPTASATCELAREQKTGESTTAPTISLFRHWRTAPVASLVLLGLLGLAVAAVVLVGLNVRGWRDRRQLGQRRPMPARKIMLAVLPFENLSHDPEQEYFSEGMTEEMITQLGGLQPERLGIIARVSCMKYKNASKSIDQIGKELGVDYVLESSVRRSGDRVRVTAQLIEVKDQTHVWAQTYDRDLRDVLAVQADVARGIAEEVQIKLPPAVDGRLTRSRPVNQEVYEDYLKGQYFLGKWTQKDWQKGKEYLERAVAKDPTYAPAYSGLSAFYLRYGGDPPLFDPREAFEMRVPKAEAAARKAIALDDSLVDGHISLASIYFYYYWDWAATEKEIKRGLHLNPSHGGGHSSYAEYLRLMGLLNESLAEYKRASELSPLEVGSQVGVGEALFFLGRYDEAIDAFRKAVELDPSNPGPHGDLTAVYEKEHMYKESIAEWQLSLKLDPSPRPDDATLLGRTYLASGFDEAKKTVLRKQLERAKESEKRGHAASADLARLYALLGDKEQAFYWLERCYSIRSWIIVVLKFDPDFDNLRSDPRFSALLRKAGIPFDAN